MKIKVVDKSKPEMIKVTKGDKIRVTLLKKNPNYFSEIGKLGGKASTNRPLKNNPERARELANIRWGKK